MSSHQSRPRDQRASRETGFSLEAPESLTFGRRRGQDRKRGETVDIGLHPLGWLQRHCPLGCVVVLTNTKTCVTSTDSREDITWSYSTAGLDFIIKRGTSLMSKAPILTVSASGAESGRSSPPQPSSCRSFW